jgi:hypothetical protein
MSWGVNQHVQITCFPSLFLLFCFITKRVSVPERERERERERDGIEGSHTSPRPSADPNPNPNRTETAGTGSERWIPPLPFIARRRSYDERRCHRQSPLRGQELPQGRSLQGLLRFPLPFPFSRENACLVPEKI